MERPFSSLTRQFSRIEGLQKPYTLVYSLNAEGPNGCELTLCRTGAHARVESLHLPVAPEICSCVLQFLCENAVQPELCRDVLADIWPLETPGGKGGVVCER